MFNVLSPNPTKWPNTLKTIRRLLPTNYLSGFSHFVGLALKVLIPSEANDGTANSYGILDAKKSLFKPATAFCEKVFL